MITSGFHPPFRTVLTVLRPQWSLAQKYSVGFSWDVCFHFDLVLTYGTYLFSLVLQMPSSEARPSSELSSRFAWQSRLHFRARPQKYLRLAAIPCCLLINLIIALSQISECHRLLELACFRRYLSSSLSLSKRCWRGSLDWFQLVFQSPGPTSPFLTCKAISSCIYRLEWRQQWWRRWL